MIKKTLVIAGFLLCLHMLFVLLNEERNIKLASMWKKNNIVAQEYLYENTSTHIIVGTSLAAKIKTDSLKGFCNLALAGLSLFDGLELIEQKTIKPDTVFVEFNHVTRPGKNDFINSMTNPVLLTTRKFLPILKAENEPMLIFQTFFFKLFGSTTLPKEKTGALNQARLTEKIEEYSKKSIESRLSMGILRLEEKVKSLEEDGVKFIFFEMPVHCKLSKLKLATLTRKEMYRVFSKKQYEYIPLPDCSSFITKDGVHLNQKESEIYTKYFRNIVKAKIK